MRDYVTAAENAGVVYLPSELDMESMQEWIDWVRCYADSIDPFST